MDMKRAVKESQLFFAKSFVRFLNKKTPAVTDVFLAQRVGFEPTRPFGQTVFKTASL